MAVSRRRVYVLLVLFNILSTASSICPAIDGCVCNVRNSVELVVACGNGASVSNVTDQLRTEGVAANVTELTFNGAVDVTLASNTFSQFVSLTTLIINFAPLSQIDPGAFNNLTDLGSLDLRSNDLMWLSAETFAGIGTSLDSLKLDRNQIQYLRSDLEPFFSTIQTEITLDDNMLDCDCNVQWLAEFIDANTLPQVRDATCSNGLPITDPSVDFSMCLDPCVQGFHSCHENATCSWNQSSGEVTCNCNSGFIGNGFTCEDICELNCNANATCEYDDMADQINCTCEPGFVGDGVTCEPAAVCHSSCHANATLVECDEMTGFVNCVCNPGFFGNGIMCTTCDPPCGENMYCVAANAGTTVYCTCNDGYVLEGSECKLDMGQDICLGESYADYMWPDTTVGTTVNLPCSSGEDVSSASVSRQCNTGGSWGELFGPECVSNAVAVLQDQLILLQADPSADPNLNMFSTELLEATINITFAGDIPEIVDLLHSVVDLLSGDSFEGDSISFENLVMVSSELLESEKHDLWLQLNESEVPNHVVELFGAMDMLGEILLFQSNTTINITTENVAVIAVKPVCYDNGTVEEIKVSSDILESTTEGSPSSLELPTSIFIDALGGQSYTCTDVGVVAVVYNGAGPLLSLDGNSLLPDTFCIPTDPPLAYGECNWYSSDSNQCPTLVVNSVIISAVVVSRENHTVNTSSLSQPVIITLQHDDITLTGPVCTFLDEQEIQLRQGTDSTWLEEGCTAQSETEDTTVCQCYHLTSFALLMSPGTGSPNENQPLHIASKVGLSLSILCLIVTIVLLFGLKLKKNKLHHIHRQLALALCLAQVVFLIGVDRTSVPSPDWLCTSIAAILHYLLLVTFAWQLVEGIHLYLFVVKVFFNEKIMRAYYPCAWGIPLIIVAITVGVRFCDYGSEHYCWVTNENGSNWAFHGPVIAVLVINLVILFIVTIVIGRATRRKEENAGLLCTVLHASLVLLPILGITWVLGFLIIGDDIYSTVIEWLFFVFTTLQGVAIFIMHCLLSREVRAAFLKAIGCHEAAKRQTTIMTQSRRMSRSSSTQSFQTSIKNFLFPYKKKDIYPCEDITSRTFQADGISGVFSNTDFVIARPENDLEAIEEEAESAYCSSTSGSPKVITHI